MTYTPSPPRILVVEDEFIISDMIAGYLREQRYAVTGEAISYEEAVALYRESPPDLALLDIRLSGPRTGIDFAHFLRQEPDPIPFIYLTSQVDERHLTLARDTFPAGYLSKPIQVNSLLASISIALHNHRSIKREEVVNVKSGHSTHLLPVSSIQHIKAEHVYVHLALSEQRPLTLRKSLTELVNEIGSPAIVQTHRSYAVNLAHVTRYDSKHVYVADLPIPLSNTYRQEVLERLLV